MAMDQILLGGFVDEEVKKINDNFAKCAEESDIPEVSTKTSDLTNDSDFVNSTQLYGKVDKIAGKDLSSNDYTTAEKTKVGRLGKIDFTTSNFGAKQTDGYYYATLSAGGKYPVKVMRKSGSDYEEVLAHTKVSGNNIVICSAVAFEGYVVTV